MAGGRDTEVTVCPGSVVGWVLVGGGHLTDGPPLGPAHQLDEEPRWGVPLCPQPPQRVVRQAYSRLFRPWFTFSASARALAPPSPMLLLENLQEMGHGWSTLAG